jgi:hypothetical protein
VLRGGRVSSTYLRFVMMVFTFLWNLFAGMLFMSALIQYSSSISKLHRSSGELLQPMLLMAVLEVNGG